MTQSLLLVGLFLAVLACLPFAVKWLKQRSTVGTALSTEQSRFISAVAVGPNQSVVTVEAGPEGARVWLTLGVTPQAITCLHVAQAGGQAPRPGGLRSGAETAIAHAES